jgi:apolipoprotein N-acyltransferase
MTGAPIILDWETYAATNSTILVKSDGSFAASYAKMHPVPFAEAIPLWEYEWFRKFMRKTVGLESGWVMGDHIQLFDARGSGGKIFRYATPICFEDAFASLARDYYAAGADLLVNLTNDSWSRKKSAQYQHWAIARLRAIENRRTLVRSTNSGVSSVVDAWGLSIVEFPQFEAHAEVVSIPVYAPNNPTIYARLGDWFALLCALLFTLRTVINFTEAKR